ncbi:MAG: hypothetical protein PHD37_10040 [Gallionellaceae bacterium]|nr:hypothetical protein [Gallionellaceae bacterium]
MKRVLFAFITFLPLASVGAHAAVDALSSGVVPATVYVASGRTGGFNVTWRVRTTSGPSVTSSQGQFLTGGRAGGAVLGTVPLTLSRSVAAGASALITESVNVPQVVIQKALALNVDEVVYRRYYADPTDVVPIPFDVRVVITGAQAAGLSVNRQAIAFDDNTPVRIVAPRLFLGAWSEITLSGSGLVEGVWEIAEPPSTSGQAVFRTLRVVRQFAQSGAPLRLDSPALPTHSPGLYLLRLRLTQPLPEFDAPEIRYFVAQPGATPAARELRLLSPGPGALLEENTRFTWASQEGTQSWLLVLYERPAGLAGNLPELGAAPLPDAAELAQLTKAAPAAGIVVPGGQSGVTLSAMARTHLKSGGAYLWRVLGLGKDGVVLGESSWRVIRVP